MPGAKLKRRTCVVVANFVTCYSRSHHAGLRVWPFGMIERAQKLQLNASERSAFARHTGECDLWALTSMSSQARPCTFANSSIVMTLPVVTVRVYPVSKTPRESIETKEPTVSSMNLRIDLNPTILGDHLIRDGNALKNRDALVDDRIVLHVRHAQHTIDLRDSQPMQDIRHQRLKPHVFDPSDILSAFEVLARPIAAPFSGVVDEVFRDFAQSTAFLAEIDHHATATALSFFDRLFHAEYQIWPTGTDI